ncbi:flagellar basal body-associated FliL family protein [Rhodanobacter sp. DHB23]|uniref:flagellar basal body-associated FliL family protein n=1 Tax=Rhodanobacter sp. DHB23 TaxID=2775923 RepID=UPI0017833801|nr:flagellar basal body-associated FliL family protein [Rhodanobacter sp. DHB23]MBD8871259.1 flagellar basal body-associated FliL family protein [Rhodanobacter sp. DHB23]
MADEEQAAPASAPRKSKLLVVIGAVAVLALAGGGYFWHMESAARAQASAEAASKIDLYLPLDPPFVVNFKDGDSLRYLQVAVTLMSHDQKALDAAKDASPVVRDALVSLFSNQDFSVISSADGRRKLQDQALATVQKIVKERTGKPGIDALYFTSFVMQ